MNKLLLSILLILFLLEGKAVQSRIPRIGETAPELKLTGLLQTSGKLDENLKSLQGKVVVLEFWATSCAPCIEAMPRLNSLSEKYKDRNIQFISISNESVEKVKPFLKKRRINGWVGIDGNYEMTKTYNVEYLPFTVLIGANGKILRYQQNELLSEEMLNNALEGKEPFQPDKPVPADEKPSVPDFQEPLYELSIRPSVQKGMSSSISPNIFRIKGIEALEVIKTAFDAELLQTEVTTTLPAGKFDIVSTNLKKGSPEWSWRTPLQKLLQDVWEIDVRREQKEMEVYELVTTSAAKKRLVKAKPGDRKESTAEGVLVGRNSSIAILAKILQDLTAVPVVNLTNLNEGFDYNLYYNAKEPETIIASLEKEMGLKLLKVKRPVELLLISKRE